MKFHIIKRSLGLLLVVLFLAFHTSPAFAESPEEAAKNISVEEKKHGPYKDKTTYYTDLDAISYEELKEVQEKEEDKGFTLNPFNAISGYFSEKVDDTMNSAKDMMASVLLMMVSLIFQFNIMMTDFLVTCLDASMNADIINFLITVAEKEVQAISGVSNNHINVGNGIFGGLAGLAGLIAVAYMVYLYAIKRAPLASLQSLIQPLLVITLSIVFFSNFLIIIKGVNSVTTDLTNSIASATSEGDVDSIGDSIQKVFVHRPYLYLQFDSGNEEKIGKKRIESLLLHKQNSPEKRAVIKKEIKDHKNVMLEVGSVLKRLIYTGLFVCVNGILSIPVWILAFLNVALQIWFLLIATMAPFILIWAILPNQFPVMRRFGIELLYPMAMKVILGFVALLVFTFSQLAFAIPATKGLTGYYLSTFFQIIFFFVIFLMRDRIKSIFGATTGFVKEMRQSTQVAMAPVKEGVQNTAMVIGAGVGAATGNPHAAISGAAIGKNLGKAITGEKDAVGTAAQLVSLSDIVQKRKEQGEKTTQPNPTSGSTSSIETETTHSTEISEKEDQRSVPALQDIETNQVNDSHEESTLEVAKEETPVSSKYVPLQDLKDFQPRTNNEEKEKQQAVAGGENVSTSKNETLKHQDQQAITKQEKRSTLHDLPKSTPSTSATKQQELSQKPVVSSKETLNAQAKQQDSIRLIVTKQDTPIQRDQSLESEVKTEPNYQEIQSYQEEKQEHQPSSLTKQQVVQSVPPAQDIPTISPTEEHHEEEKTNIQEVGNRHKEDLKMGQRDLNDNE